MSKKSKCEELISKSQDIGDKLLLEYEKTQDLKVVQTALSAFKAAVNAAKSQLIYKKLTGRPAMMDFFE